MLHPLSGADIGTLATVVRRSGLPDKAGQAMLIALCALARWPFSTAEKVFAGSRIPATEQVPPPVFILGHWRSGTTHLYNTMCRSGTWGFVPPVATGLPWDLFGLAKLFSPLLERALPAHRYIDNIPVTPDSPQEDEIAIANMSDISFYHGIYFPREFYGNINRGLFFDGCSMDEILQWKKTFTYFLRKLYLHQGKRPLLIKNPVYTARAGIIREIFPSAKFIHIHRNPYEVFISMRNFYKRLLERFSLQNYPADDIDDVILSVYGRMMRIYESESAQIPAGSLVELRYEDLDADPLRALEVCYAGLELPGFDDARPHFERYIASVGKFEKNRFEYSAEAALKVERHLRYFIDKQDYKRPQCT